MNDVKCDSMLGSSLSRKFLSLRGTEHRCSAGLKSDGWWSSKKKNIPALGSLYKSFEKPKSQTTLMNQEVDLDERKTLERKIPKQSYRHITPGTGSLDLNIQFMIFSHRVVGRDK